MSKQTAQNIIRKKIESEAAKYVGDVDRIIRRQLEAATLSLMGIEKRGSHAEIDHCNGRNSVLIDAFRDQAMSEAKRIARTVKISPEERSLFKASFEREYNKQVHSAVMAAARERAKADAEELVKSISMDITKFIEE